MHAPHAFTPWLVVGLLTGLTLAMMGLVELNAPALDPKPQFVATVGEEHITKDEYRDALQAVAADRRAPLDAATRAHVLDQLINERLLAQYGKALDLPLRAPRLRDALVDEVLEMIRVEAESEAFTAAELEAYLDAHPERFRGPDLLHVRAWYAADADAAQALAERLRAPSTQPPTANRAPLPDGLVPADTLRDYVGPEAVAVIESLSTGEVAEPVAAGQRFLVLQLQARQRAETPALKQVENAVRNAVQRERAEALLEQRLEALRARYGVEIRDAQP